jgi:hypothetical protein
MDEAQPPNVVRGHASAHAVSRTGPPPEGYEEPEPLSPELLRIAREVFGAPSAEHNPEARMHYIIAERLMAHGHDLAEAEDIATSILFDMNDAGIALRHEDDGTDEDGAPPR